MPDRAELERRRDRIEEEIADAVAHIERIEAGVENLKKARADADEVQERQRLHGRIQERLELRKRLKADIEARQGRLEKVSRKIKRLARRARNRIKPKIIELDLTFRPMTPQGVIIGTTGHYTAGPRDDDVEEAIRLWRAYHTSHLNLGWSGLGYQIGFTIDGSIVLLRPFTFIGSHTYQNNTGRIGGSVHGPPGDTWTDAQKRAFDYWLEKGHTSVFPASHRTPKPPKELQRRVHKDFNATSCPGDFESGYRN